MKVTPSAAMRSTRRWTTRLSSFIFGMPYMSSPPMRSARSKTVTVWPTLFSWAAAQSPAGPEPTTATFFPVMIDDAALHVLDRDGWSIDAQNAGALARSGTDAAGEFGKIIGFVQPFERFLPEAAIDEI